MSLVGLAGLAPLLLSLPLIAPADGRKAASGPAVPAAAPAATSTTGTTRGARDSEEKAPAPSAKAKQALAEASKAKRAASGLKAEEKLAALVRAATEYERVARALADERAAAAEASFRAGEIWRTVRHEEDARRCFTAATAEAGSAPGFAARAWMELGHLERRQKRFDGALRAYGCVLAITPEQRRECVRALTWRGKTQIEQKNEKDGHATLLAVGERYPDFPLDDIRSVDLVAVDWIKAGRVAEARDLVNDCIERHDDSDDPEDESEPAIRKALERMKSRELLASPPDPKK